MCLRHPACASIVGILRERKLLVEYLTLMALLERKGWKVQMSVFLSAGGATADQWMMVTSSRWQSKCPCPNILQIWDNQGTYRTEKHGNISNQHRRTQILSQI